MSAPLPTPADSVLHPSPTAKVLGASGCLQPPGTSGKVPGASGCLQSAGTSHSASAVSASATPTASSGPAASTEPAWPAPYRADPPLTAGQIQHMNFDQFLGEPILVQNTRENVLFSVFDDRADLKQRAQPTNIDGDCHLAAHHTFTDKLLQQ